MEFLVARRAAFPDRRFVVEDMIAEGDKVSARFTMRGTHKGPLQGIASRGKEVTMTGIDMIRLSEGKMVEDRVEVDQLGMMQQLGAVKAPQQWAPRALSSSASSPIGSTTAADTPMGAKSSPSGMQRMPTGPAEGTRAPCGETTTVPCVRSHPK
jgi:hypothetical protein